MTDINNRATQELKTEFPVIESPTIIPTDEVEVVGFVQDQPDEEAIDPATVI